MIQSVDRALQLISIVSTRKEGFGVTELASKLEINKSSIFRILSTLVEHQYVEQDPETKRYKLGYKCLELSSKLLDSIDIRAEAKPYLKELEKQFKEVVHLVTFDQGEVVYIEKLEGSEPLRMHSQVGKRAPMHCTSVGKVILAYLPKEQVEEILKIKGLPKQTEHTIDNLAELYAQLDLVRDQGYGYEVEENQTGISCVAAPIFNNKGAIVGALSISGASIRMDKKRMKELKDHVIEMGHQISKRLGYNMP